MWWETINDILNYAVVRYSVPKVKWEKRRFELRMLEIYTYEQVIKRCMDKPNTDPIDIMEDYLLYVIMAETEFEGNDIRLEEYRKMENVVNNLIKRYNSKELSSGRIYI